MDRLRERLDESEDISDADADVIRRFSDRIFVLGPSQCFDHRRGLVLMLGVRGQRYDLLLHLRSINLICTRSRDHETVFREIEYLLCRSVVFNQLNIGDWVTTLRPSDSAIRASRAVSRSRNH